MNPDSLRHARPERVYSNFLRVGCNAFEFVLDFCDYRNEEEEPRSVAAVVAAPAIAKAFAKTLQQSLEDYEQRFGKLPDEPA